MYYIGTEQECIDYDTLVTENENYVNNDNWSNPIKHSTEEKWAIIAHSNYSSSMTPQPFLEDGWFPIAT